MSSGIPAKPGPASLVPRRGSAPRCRADREPRSCASADRGSASRRAPGWRVARRCATSTPANASSPASISPVGPPPAITTACSVTATPSHGRLGQRRRPAHQSWAARPRAPAAALGVAQPRQHPHSTTPLTSRLASLSDLPGWFRPRRLSSRRSPAPPDKTFAARTMRLQRTAARTHRPGQDRLSPAGTGYFALWRTMTGPEHYAEAERLLTVADCHTRGVRIRSGMDTDFDAAHVHTTLEQRRGRRYKRKAATSLPHSQTLLKSVSGI